MKNFEEKFFAGNVERVKIYPSGASIANGILKITLKEEKGEEKINVQMQDVENYNTYMFFRRVQAAECISIQWLSQPEEGCVMISKDGVEARPCKMTIEH